jgi:CBS domain-containing protein
MTTDVVTVHRENSIFDAIKKLVKHNITGLPVVNEDGIICGIISEKDMLRLLCDENDIGGKVKDYMTKEVVSFDHEADVIDIAQAFLQKNFRRVPIVEKGRPVGIISKKDVIGYILRQKSEEKIAV